MLEQGEAIQAKLRWSELHVPFQKKNGYQQDQRNHRQNDQARIEDSLRHRQIRFNGETQGVSESL